MKLSTDAVLLGAWAKCNDAQRVLDIGTGTGILALMMAQKNSYAQIDAIEISEAAFTCAAQNFASSPWQNRLNLTHTSLQQYHSAKLYDLIIVNPPYFNASELSEYDYRNHARQQVLLTEIDLLTGINQLLQSNGFAYVVIPYSNTGLFLETAAAQNLYARNLMHVQPTPAKPAYITLLCLGRQKQSLQIEALTIRKHDGTLSEQYVALTSDFYL